MHRNTNATGRLGIQAASLLVLDHTGTEWGPVVKRLRELLPQLVEPPVGPTPTGDPLHVEIDCEPRSGGPPHRLTVDNDWTTTTVHDLAAENVAIALGARVPPCLVATRQVPHVRRWLQAVTRRQPPRLIFNRAEATWTDTSFENLNLTQKFMGPLEVGRHRRHRPTRQQARTDVPRDTAIWFDVLADAMALEHRITPSIGRPDLPTGSPPATTNDAVLDWLWDVGLSPALVARLHQAADVGERPLPLEVILAVLTDIQPPAACEPD